MILGDVLTLRRRAKTIWTRHQSLLIVLAIILLAAGLRLYDIDANGLNNDETYTLWLAEHDTAFILRFTTLAGQDANNPPLHFLLARALLLVGDEPQLVRLLSALAGTIIVGFTFYLAAHLFDLRIATVGAFLMAVAPLHIAYSRVGRAHILASLWALLSLVFLARILFSEARIGHWVGLVVATAAAFWTFHTVFLLALFENAWVLVLWLRRQLSRQVLIRWIISQAVLALLVLPVVLSAFLMASDSRIGWLTRPELESVVRSIILFSTGDPSYGSSSVTPARVLSLMAIASLAVLGLWVFFQRGYHRQLDSEGERVLFLIGALGVPWAMAFLISQVRPIYKERYLLFLMPPLFILFAWVLTRARAARISMLALGSLLCLTGLALSVYYTEPFTEQWRETATYLQSKMEPDDLIIISPGFYGIPFSYYFSESFPDNIDSFEGSQAIVVEKGSYRTTSFLDGSTELHVNDTSLTTCRRVWLVSGYQPADPVVIRWAEQEFESPESTGFVGTNVNLLERINAPDRQASTQGE